MRSRKRVLGTLGPVVAAASQPTPADVVDRDRHLPERHDDTEAEGRWIVPVKGPVDVSSSFAGPVGVTVAGSDRSHLVAARQVLSA